MFAYDVIGDLPVAAIDTGLVVRVLDPVWKGRPETASRLRGRIETVLGYAAHRGLREAGLNPAQWRGHLEHSFPSRRKVRQVEHLAALPFDELPAFMAKLRDREEIAARALEFLVLTASRSGEVRGARWGEIDIERRVWTVPALRMKANREHRVTLSGTAVAVLVTVRPLAPQQDGSPDPAALVFPGVRQARPIAEGAMLAVLRRMGRADTTVHGFRSSFSDWAAERTGYPHQVVEMALAHTIESAVERAYRRGDLLEKRAMLMEAWARFCEMPAASREVVPIRSAG